jgi:hypothetical protein
MDATIFFMAIKFSLIVDIYDTGDLRLKRILVTMKVILSFITILKIFQRVILM